MLPLLTRAGKEEGEGEGGREGGKEGEREGERGKERKKRALIFILISCTGLCVMIVSPLLTVRLHLSITNS